MKIGLPPEITSMSDIIDELEEVSLDIQTDVFMNSLYDSRYTQIPTEFSDDVLLNYRNRVNDYLKQSQNSLALSVRRIIDYMSNDILNKKIN